MPVVVVWVWALWKPWFQGFLGRELTVVAGSCGVAVGPIETMVPRLPGQGVNGSCCVAVGPMVPGLPGQKVNGNIR